ncbi:MAG: ribose transport system permease protein [Halanaerobiales bacterium]|nr:ribose transport system permease protein [Halanaerobiales bacterium]
MSINTSVKKQPLKSDFFEKYGVLVGLGLLIIFFSIKTPRFISARNIISLLRQISILSLLSSGLTFSMILNEFDLSVGEIAGLSGVLVVTLLITGYSFFLSILIVLIIGILFGFLNGIIVTKLKILSFIATLAMSTIALGVNYFITRGKPIYGEFPAGFKAIGRGYIGSIPVPVIVAFVVLILGVVLTKKTKYGRYMYAIGGNIIAAKHSGINTDRYRILGLTLSGLSAAIGGIVLASRLGSGQPTAGSGYMLDCFAAVFLGTAIFGRKVANITGTFIGVVIIGVLSNGLTMIAVPYYYEYMVKGLVLIGAVSLTSVLGHSR